MTGDGVSYLPVILPLMYRMAELYASSSSACGLDEDEGVGCHNDPLPRVLCEVLNILSAFNQAQKTQAEKVCFIGKCLCNNICWFKALPQK